MGSPFKHSIDQVHRIEVVHGLGVNKMDQGPRTGDPGQRTQDRGPRTEDPGQRTQDRGPRTENPGQRTHDRGPTPEDQDRGPNSEDQGLRTVDQEASVGLRIDNWGSRTVDESEPWMTGFHKLNYKYIKVYEVLWAAEMAQCTMPRGFFSGYSGFPHS